MKDIMLIVDDIELNRRILKSLFCKEYEIIEAKDGKEALSFIEDDETNIGIVLLDLILPDMTGFDILERGKEIEFFPQIPVVVITGSEQIDDQVKAFELGANDYIAKPFVPEVVLSRIENVVSANKRIQTVELEAEKLKIKSELDAMTGLLNKTTTELAINSILEHKEGTLEVMLVIDIDHFKTVNDTLGHQVGDHVIKIVADLISSEFRKTDIVGRIGGDEFCVLMKEVSSIEVAYKKLNEMLLIMRYKPNISIPEYVTLSIGMAVSEGSASDYATLFKKADEALYQAKQGGRARYCEYGVESVAVEEDERPVVLLVSHNRSVASVIYAHMPNCVRVENILKIDDADTMEIDKNKVILMLVDISDLSGDASSCWTQIAQMKWINIKNVFAICREGNISQYLAALHSGIGDLFTAPLDYEGFKRRIVHRLEEFGILEKDK